MNKHAAHVGKYNTCSVLKKGVVLCSCNGMGSDKREQGPVIPNHVMTWHLGICTLSCFLFFFLFFLTESKKKKSLETINKGLCYSG